MRGLSEGYSIGLTRCSCCVLPGLRIFDGASVGD